MPEDAALVINSADGTVVLTGCGHAGVMNICERAHAILGPQPIAGLIGGLHLFLNNRASVEATGARHLGRAPTLTRSSVRMSATGSPSTAIRSA